ncbi:hypothetical protein HYU11_00615 [Candidatus Woesearchaeota archaeon]|nr:hypothetical protein [Candidatus Woesearchaeota archaeon]
MKRIFLGLFIFVLLTSAVTAETRSMKVLAVSEKNDGFEGITADLFLEIRPGSGKVFIESFPLSKIDTQISTRLASEIACNELEISCEGYDFFYTIKADTSVIEGPSAGAAASVLTLSALKNVDLRRDATITGTINSGGLIGHVGGIKEKIEAASRSGIRKVLIPDGERFSANNTLDLVEYGKDLGVQVIEVSDVGEAFFHLTGRELGHEQDGFGIDKSYSDTMSFLAATLCNKSDRFIGDFPDSSEDYDSALNLTVKGKNALAESQFYSAASYCFGANVKFQYINLSSLINSTESLMPHVNRVISAVERMEREKPRLETMTDLQSFISMKERLLEANDNANLSLRYMRQNRSKESIYALAYAEERVFSAMAWSSFFGKPGKKFVFDSEVLESSCRRKIAEAEERFEYSKLFIERGIPDTRQEINRAFEDLANGRFELCLSKAAKAKAQSDVLFSSINVDSSRIGELLDKKLAAAKKSISRSTRKGIFPIVGYSYYEYATSLKETDPYSALLYSEFALELSNMDLYFRSPSRLPEKKSFFSYQMLGSFIVGFGIGGISVLVLFRRRNFVKKAVLRRRN